MPSNRSEHARRVDQLFVKHASTIRGFIQAFVPDFHRADDVLQECFLTVADKAEEFREDTDFLAWATTIARFKVHESLRRPGPKTQSLSPEVIDALCADAPAAATDSTMAWLLECEELAPRARELIELRYGEECKPAEIARRLEWTAESVYVALSRARALLRDCIERKAQQGEARRDG